MKTVLVLRLHQTTAPLLLQVREVVVLFQERNNQKKFRDADGTEAQALTQEKNIEKKKEGKDSIRQAAAPQTTLGEEIWKDVGIEVTEMGIEEDHAVTRLMTHDRGGTVADFYLKIKTNSNKFQNLLGLD